MGGSAGAHREISWHPVSAPACGTGRNLKNPFSSSANLSGRRATETAGMPLAWIRFRDPGNSTDSKEVLMGQQFAILPDTEENRTLGENVHPSTWKNPVPADCYNLVVI